MKLYLLQHGDSLPEEVNPDRPLSERGREDVKRLAKFLGRSGKRISRIYHSGKTRALESAQLVAAKMAPGLAVEIAAGLKPNDPVEPVAKQINGWTEDTLLAGHMPFLGRLAAYLLTGNSDSVIAGFQPGSMVCLERGEQGRWVLLWMLRPELFT